MKPAEKADRICAALEVGMFLVRAGGRCEHPKKTIIRCVSGSRICGRCGIDTREEPTR